MTAPLSRRLVVVAAITVVLLLPVAGGLLSAAFRQSVEASFDRRLEALLTTLAGLIENRAGADDAVLELSRPLSDPRFERLHSGWYWQVARGDQVLATSRSLWDDRLLPVAPLRGPRGEPLRRAQLDLSLPAGGSPVHLLVTGPQGDVDLEVAAFNRLLTAALGSLGLLLIAAFAAQIRWGLAPLRRLGDDLKRVRAGDQPMLDAGLAKELPRDLAEIASAINEVLAHQQALIERARSATGNLAHALKQPLASLRLQLDGERVDSSAAQASLVRLGQTVDHHLSRAAAAGQISGLYRRVSCRDSLLPVVEAVRAIHASRGLDIVAELPAGYRLRIDAQDLQELAGNLLDNAALAARSMVRLSVLDAADGLLMRVDDDGPGIPDAAHALVVERGVCLDEQRPGSGLGLAIVRDLAELHGLSLQLSASPLGGLRVGVHFPDAAGQDRDHFSTKARSNT